MVILLQTIHKCRKEQGLELFPRVAAGNIVLRKYNVSGSKLFSLIRHLLKQYSFSNHVQLHCNNLKYPDPLKRNRNLY